MMGRTALLLGFFVAPLLLLGLGHRLRERTPRQRGAFWGGVIGHTVGLVVAVGALHFPAVLWSGELRVFLAFWLMLVGTVAGALAGAVIGRAHSPASAGARRP